MTIDQFGNVGIGSFDSNYKLDVNGTAHFTGKVNIGSTSNFSVTNGNGAAYYLAVEGGILSQELTVELSVGNWPDFVFEEDYDLMTLPKLKTYLGTYKHLPNTSSAAKIEQEGLELKSMTIAQQQNIEDIYLHLIQLNERITQLETENKTLKKVLNKK